ncbi:MAG: WbuC family cupin fold metalloprotein [Burkholderiales bacterium]|jgi:cupin fold WbuC family metalloprotein|nr:WbuC family cupin fold metalloprotein [Burkholderiales bacterium]
MTARVPVLIDGALLDATTAAARASGRLRRHHNFHHGDTDACHRLLNAIEPGSYVPPHRHLDAQKDETFVVLRGRFGVVLFDDAGAVVRTEVLSVGTGALGLTVPHGTWHTLLALEPGSVFLEAKAGPYSPLADKERAPWAPAEGDPAAPAYLDALRRRFD